MKVFVGNLSRETTEEDLQEKFEPFGKILSVRIVRDMFSRESKGFGFVEMPKRTEATEAIEKLNTISLKGKPMAVNEARPENPRRKRHR
jgi:RNA recognition motif-containing protein